MSTRNFHDIRQGPDRHAHARRRTASVARRRTLQSGEPVQAPLHARVRERTIHLLSLTARRDERCRSTLDSSLQAHDRVIVDDLARHPIRIDSRNCEGTAGREHPSDAVNFRLHKSMQDRAQLELASRDPVASDANLIR